MNRLRGFVAAFLAAFFASSSESQAEVIGTFGPVTIEATRAPTIGLSGFSTWAIAATSDIPLQRFDFFTADGTGAYGFFGTLNQLYPAGAQTPFLSDWGSVDCLCDRRHDSNLGVAESAYSGSIFSSVDSATQLSGVFILTTPQSGTMTFARLVIPDAAAGIVSFRGQIGFAAAAAQEPVTVFGQIGVPEPATFILLWPMLLVPCATRRQHRVARC